MSVTQRGALSQEDEQRLLSAKAADDQAAQVRRDYMAVVAEMIEKSSYREVARLTGLSTNTLQRWKRILEVRDDLTDDQRQTLRGLL